MLFRSTFSIAYLTFDSEAILKEFQTECNGHIFLDEKGTSNKMQIEVALWQKIPNKKQKLPEISGTYENTNDFKAFIDMVNKEVEPALRVDQMEEEKEEHKIAPLVNDLNEYSGRRRGQRARRNPRGHKEEQPDTSAPAVITYTSSGYSP